MPSSVATLSASCFAAFSRRALNTPALCDDEGVDLIQEALAYRLPWAMEAVRVHAVAVGHEGVDALTGLAALAVEAGLATRRSAGALAARGAGRLVVLIDEAVAVVVDAIAGGVLRAGHAARAAVDPSIQ